MRKIERTRLRLQECALDVMERNGFEATTVAEIAAAAHVTPMTFFRHFPTKESVVIWDPFDPAMAGSVRGRAGAGGSALDAVCRGLLDAWRAAGVEAEPVARRRARLVAASPALRAAMHSGIAETEAAVVAALRESGYGRWESTAAVGGCLGALVAVLLDWAADDRGADMTAAIGAALHALAPEPSGVPER